MKNKFNLNFIKDATTSTKQISKKYYFYEIKSTKLSLYNLIVKTFICRQENNGKRFLGVIFLLTQKWKLNPYYYNTTEPSRLYAVNTLCAKVKYQNKI